MSEMVQIAQTEISINSNTTGLKYKLVLKLLDISKICCMIQRLNSYNLLIGKVAEKVPWANYRPDEKNYKSTRELEINFL